MSRIIVVSLTLFIIIYMFIPYLITRIWGLGVTIRGRSARQVAFTFDDGPDPLHTPKLLDVLKRQGVKGPSSCSEVKLSRIPSLQDVFIRKDIKLVFIIIRICRIGS